MPTLVNMDKWVGPGRGVTKFVSASLGIRFGKKAEWRQNMSLFFAMDSML